MALGTIVVLGLSLLGNGKTPMPTRRALPPAVSLLLFFLIWSVLVTLVAPVLFDGMTVLVPPAPTTLTATGGWSDGSVGDETESSLPQAASIKIAHTDNGIRPVLMEVARRQGVLMVL